MIIMMVKEGCNFIVTFECRQYTTFFYKQPVYRQLALGWETAKQLSGLSLLSLSNNKNYIKKSGVFPLQLT